MFVPHANVENKIYALAKFHVTLSRALVSPDTSRDVEFKFKYLDAVSSFWIKRTLHMIFLSETVKLYWPVCLL